MALGRRLVPLLTIILLQTTGRASLAMDRPVQLLLDVSASHTSQDVTTGPIGSGIQRTEVVVGGGLARTFQGGSQVSFTVGMLNASKVRVSSHDAYEMYGVGLTVGYDRQVWKALHVGLKCERSLQSIRWQARWTQVQVDQWDRQDAYHFSLDESQLQAVTTWIPHITYLVPLAAGPHPPTLRLAAEARVREHDYWTGFDVVSDTNENRYGPPSIPSHVSFRRRAAAIGVSVGVGL